MKNFANTLADIIVENETPRLDNIMQEVSKKIQGDVVAVTYNVIDFFYQDYKPQYYIRTDDYKKRFKK